ncbi:TPM domain-containing protein [Hymenobacter weizhouensis]|uniref:TPM domain-containing protein n=1 Tax=Hymenobacter sp. YIM 151500-1 TaxID=2987689 RepID=UPI0022271657|nr:TPM domain-containing protein [Hymenobacter sp. YIM 151500-1]UYZ62630.1 TPM domain-containing protein [Hymenobacter sp. YIM 151500-1]
MPFRLLLLARFCLVLLLLPVPGLAATQPPDDLAFISNPKTLGEAYVSNPDRILSEPTVRRLNTQLAGFDRAGKAHIDVVVVRSIGGQEPKDAATTLFNRWKIGDATLDNGLLLLLVLDQRRVEFETGYGLEASLPDVICYRIQQRFMLPHLRAGSYDTAVTEGVAAIIRHLSGQPILAADTLAAAVTDISLAVPEAMPGKGSLPTVGSAWQESYVERYLDNKRLIVWLALSYLLISLLLWFLLIRQVRWKLLWVAVALMPLLWFARQANFLLFYYDGWLPDQALLVAVWYGSLLAVTHLGFWLLGRRLRPLLAGASRHRQYLMLQRTHYALGWTAYLFPLPKLAHYWARHRQRLRQLRDEPYACAQCTQPMQRLPETQDDAHLNRGQAAEEAYASVDYDVWRCTACQVSLTLPYRNLASNAEPCTECGYRMLFFDRKEVVESPTESASGWGWRIYQCRFCQHVHKHKYSIPKLSSSSGSSGSSSSGGGSSYSSGSSGGGSYSTSSGGSSGGGGAGSSW